MSQRVKETKSYWVGWKKSAVLPTPEKLERCTLKEP